MSSCGSWSITARATVSPPKPESKIPIGASAAAAGGIGPARTAEQSRACTSAGPNTARGDDFGPRAGSFWRDDQIKEETMLDLEAPARALQRLADGVTDDQL